MSPKYSRRFRTVGIVLVAALAGIAVAGTIMDWLVVDVRMAGGTGEAHRLWIPVPMAAVRLAASAVSSSALPGEPVPEEIRAALPAIRSALAGLARCPDAELVSVETDEATVRVAKRGRLLVLDVRAPDATVHGSIPIGRLSRTLGRWNGRTVDATLMRSALTVLDDGFEIAVDADDATVRISVR